MHPPSDPSAGSVRDQGPAIALVSAGAIAWQLALMQLLAWVHWHHFAYLVISLALLGFGASGTVITIARGWFVSRVPQAMMLSACGAAAGMVAAIALLATPPLRMDLYLLFADGAEAPRLIGVCMVLAVPFFFCGLLIGLALTAGAARSGTLYAWNLAGSGAGGVAGWMLLGVLEPVPLCVALAALPLAGAALLVRSVRGMRIRAGLAVAVTAAAIVWAAATPPRIRPSQFKDLSRLLDLPGAAVSFDAPDPHGWLQIVDAPAVRPAAPGSLRFSGEYPRQRAVLLDGNLRGSILPNPSNETLAFLDFSLESVAWRMADRSKILLLHGGGEGIAAWAVARGATQVVCVEPHPVLAREIKEAIPRGAVVSIADPRTVLAQDGETFDVIRFPMAGAFGGSVGMQAVGEQTLHTREAFAVAFNRLAPDGVIIASAWSEEPARNIPRLLSTMLAGLEVAGIGNPREYIAGIRSWNAVALFVKRSPLSAGDIALIRRICSELEFDPLLLPGLSVGERERFHELPKTALFTQVDAILDGGGAAGDGRYRLEAATDDRPYFSQFLKISRLGKVADDYGWRTAPFVELGYLIVALSVPLLAILALGLIIAPLARIRWNGPSHAGWRTAFFCTGLGFGFMFVEIGLICRLNLFLGGALPAAATTLTSLLVFAGAGSLVSQRFPPRPRTLLLITLAVSVAAPLLWIITGALPLGSGLSAPARACLASLILAPGALVTGMAFPTLLRFLAAHHPSHVPWAWAVNGCASVVAPSVATVLAVLTGFGGVFAGAAIAYAIAGLAVVGWRTPR